MICGIVQSTNTFYSAEKHSYNTGFSEILPPTNLITFLNNNYRKIFMNRDHNTPDMDYTLLFEKNSNYFQ